VIATPEEWWKVKRFLAAALEREPSQRAAYLEKVCLNPSVRKEVESLMAAHEQIDSTFLECPAAEGTIMKCGAKLGSYEIISFLGAGGMGVVYKARDTKLNREVAVKVLPPNFVTDVKALARFQREAQVLASLNHPNVVTIHEIGQEGQTLYIAMEMVDGKVLSDVLSTGRMEIGTALDVATQVAAGLAVAHDSRIVHRDLKPKNIVMRRDGLVKILDFGLGKLAPTFPQSTFDRTTVITAPRTLIGTVDYMSPQQAAGLPVDFRSDQFSFGSLLYEMVTGERPFERTTAAQTLAAIIAEEPRAVVSLNPRVPAALEAIIHRCLAKKPEQRYASTGELARELKTLRESTVSTEAISIPAIARMYLRVVPRWLEIALAAVLALAGIATVAWHVPERVRVTLQPNPPVFAKQLVVLPFTNVGNDPQNQGFCDGLVEILSSRLSQLEQFQRTLRVVSASDVLGEHVSSVREARQVFGATLAITGSVQRAEGRVRLTINLVDPQTLQQLKSKTIDSEAHDILMLQDGVVVDVAELLDVKLSEQARQVLAIGGTTVPSAYEYYTQGRGYLRRYEIAQNLDSAASLFRLALEQDPKYALAESGLGEAYWRKYELTKETRWVEEARKSSEAALKLNDKLAEVYVTLGMIDSGTGRYDEAIQNLQKAVELEPINPDAYRGMAKAYQGMGRLNDAESTYLKAISVRPSYWGFHNDLGVLYFHSGRYADAEKQFQSIVQLTPDNATGYNNLGDVAYAQKRYEDAAKMFEKGVAIKPTDSALSDLGTIYYTLGQYPMAVRYYEQAIQMNGQESQWWHNLAAAYQQTHEPQKARAAFQETADLAEKERRVNPSDALVLILLADAYSNLDQPRRAGQLLERALALAPNDVSNMFQASVIYEQLGDRKVALQWLAEAIKRGFSRDLIEKEPSLAQLRLDPRYQSLLRP
jgi:tetratricopeptide (TPR) repeat protein/TolB-like protein/tRNA A-37 threonylcarbamoyl transferase component Bud32